MCYKLKITGVARGSKEGLALKGLLEGGGHPQGQLGALEGSWGPSRETEGPWQLPFVILSQPSFLSLEGSRGP